MALNFFVLRYERILTWYRTRALPWALRHGLFVVCVCAVLVINSLTLAMGAGTATVAINVVFLVLAAVWHADRILDAPRDAGGIVALSLDVIAERPRTQRALLQYRYRFPQELCACRRTLVLCDGARREAHAGNVRAAGSGWCADDGSGTDRLRFRTAGADRRDLHDGHLSARHAAPDHGKVR